MNPTVCRPLSAGRTRKSGRIPEIELCGRFSLSTLIRVLQVVLIAVVFFQTCSKGQSAETTRRVIIPSELNGAIVFIRKPGGPKRRVAVSERKELLAATGELVSLKPPVIGSSELTSLYEKFAGAAPGKSGLISSVRKFCGQLNGVKGVDELDLSDCDIRDSDLMLIPSNSTFSLIDLSRTAVTDAGLPALKKLPNLRSLFLNQTTVHGRTLNQLPLLKVIELRQCAIDEIGLRALGQLAKIDNLRLTDNSLKPEWGNLIGNIQVSDLSLANTGINDEFVYNLKAPCCKVIMIAGNPLITDLSIEAMSKWKNLTEIYADNTKVTGKGFRKFDSHNKLKMMWLAGCPLSDQAVDGLSGLTELVELRLNECPLSDAGLERLNLKRLSNLFRLSLSGTRITAAGVSTLANGLCPSMAELDLSHTAVDEKAIPYFMNMYDMVSVNLENTGFRADGIRLLRKQIPFSWFKNGLAPDLERKFRDDYWAYFWKGDRAKLRVLLNNKMDEDKKNFGMPRVAILVVAAWNEANMPGGDTTAFSLLKQSYAQIKSASKPQKVMFEQALLKVRSIYSGRHDSDKVRKCNAIFLAPTPRK